MPNLYIIAGCNGAGKTTASFSVLPDLLNVKQFVNADEIARGLSPFEPEKVSMEAGRIMLKRLDELIPSGIDFAFETTLATRSFVNLVKEARSVGYATTLVFFWLDNPALALDRVAQRVKEGGHNIPPETIQRRYKAGLINFNTLYKDLVDFWVVFDSSVPVLSPIARKAKDGTAEVLDQSKWILIEQTI